MKYLVLITILFVSGCGRLYLSLDGEIVSITESNGMFFYRIQNPAGEANARVKSKVRYSMGDIIPLVKQ